MCLSIDLECIYYECSQEGFEKNKAKKEKETKKKTLTLEAVTSYRPKTTYSLYCGFHNLSDHSPPQLTIRCSS